MFIEKTFNVHLNDRNKKAVWHLSSCPHGHIRSDSRGKWFTRLDEKQALDISKGYKRQYCSKCGS